MTVEYSNSENWLASVSYCASLRSLELISGKDPGAGYGKAIYGDMTVVVPAAYSLLRNRNINHHETIANSGAWVRYVEGSRSDLKEKQYFWGTAATAQADHTLLHENKALKAELALESILADLAILNVPDGSKLWISLSNHNPEKWEEDIKRKVRGGHTFQHKDPVSREIVTKTIEIAITGIYPEGFGSIAYCLFGNQSLHLDASEIAIALDIGSSTWLITIFNGSDAVIDRHLIEGGCGELHRAIAETLDKRNDGTSLLRKDVKHSPNLVNQGILAGTFTYGGNHLTGKVFKTEYEQCLQTWWDTRIEKFANFVTNSGYLDQAQYLVCWGGGASLPLIQERLTDIGFVTLTEPQFINAQGLKLLTEITLEDISK
jgi:Actin like proteins N terminal domain